MDDVRFDFDSSFVLPGAQREIALLRDVIERHPACPLSVFGHADPTGDDAYNRVLSERRACALFAMLLRDTTLWARLADTPHGGDRWGVRHAQQMLAALPGPGGAAYATGPADGIWGPRSSAAAWSYQQHRGLPATGVIDGATRDALFRDYMDLLCGELRLKRSDFLGGEASSDDTASYQGCGEFNPVLVFSANEATALAGPTQRARRDAENAPNRRVVVFLFEQGTRMPAAHWPCPRADADAQDCKNRFWNNGELRRSPSEVRRTYEETGDTFACRFYDRFAMGSPCEAGPQAAIVEVRLCDGAKAPIPGAPCRILHGETLHHGQADADGWLTVKTTSAPPICRIEWTLPGDELEGKYPFTREVYVEIGDGDEAGRRRLHNLGYADGASLEDKVRAYQRDRGLPETGVLADIEAELTAWHDGGVPPAKAEAKEEGEPSRTPIPFLGPSEPELPPDSEDE
jgi:hypothetical protein